MSATEVTSQCGIARSTWRAIAGSKIVTTSGSSGSRCRTSKASRNGNASSREAAQATSNCPDSTAARTPSSSGSSSQSTVAPPASERLADLLGQVAATHQEDALQGPQPIHLWRDLRRSPVA